MAQPDRTVLAALAAALACGAIVGYSVGKRAVAPPAAATDPRSHGEESSIGAAPFVSRPAAAAPAPLGEGWFAWTDMEGRLLLGRRVEDRLELCRVYRLVEDPRRHAGDPGRAAPHGAYLDDMGEEMAARRAELDRSLREVAERKGGGAAEAEAEAAREWAVELARLGGDGVLLDLLGSGGSEARRAAAVALGLHGHAEAHPVLLRMLEAPDPRTRSAAARALSALTGRAGGPGPDGNLDAGLVAGWEAWRPTGPDTEGD